MDASTPFVHEAEKEHRVGIVLGNGFVEPVESGGVISSNTNALVVSATEDRLGARIALRSPGLGALQRLGVVPRRPGCRHGEVARVGGGFFNVNRIGVIAIV